MGRTWVKDMERPEEFIKHEPDDNPDACVGEEVEYDLDGESE